MLGQSWLHGPVTKETSFIFSVEGLVWIAEQHCFGSLERWYGMEEVHGSTSARDKDATEKET